MTERPILFSGPMVRAILDGRKTVTRRPLTIPDWATDEDVERAVSADLRTLERAGWRPAQRLNLRPLGIPGDRLWARETWRPTQLPDSKDVLIEYPADNATQRVTPAADWTPPRGKWAANIPSIHMPRWASRLTLEVVSSRVERLHEITEEDAIKEGIPTLGADDIIDTEGPKYMLPRGMWLLDTTSPVPPAGSGPGWSFSARDAFSVWWSHIYGTWTDNPWITRTEFRVLP